LKKDIKRLRDVGRFRRLMASFLSSTKIKEQGRGVRL
jgi:hypothetical protein